MSNQVTITLTTDKAEGNLTDVFVNSNPSLMLSTFQNYLGAIQSGNDAASLSMKINDGNSVAASSTLTNVSVAANDTSVINGVALTAVDKREKTQVTCAADVAGSLNSTFFDFYSAADATHYYMWYNVNSAGVDPAVASATGIEVDVATGATAAAVASASRAKFALTPLSSVFTETGATDKIVFQTVDTGTTTDTADGTAATGFTFSTENQGGTVAATEFQIGTDAVTATNQSAKINAQASLAPLVVATAASNVVTVTAQRKGIEGNTITLSATGGTTAGAARLSGGTNDTSASTYNFQR